MTATADMGAHAGAVGIANGLTQDQIKLEVERIVEANMPVSLFGNVINGSTDVSFAYLDYETGTYDASATDYNTVVVDIQQTSSRGNPVQSLMSQFSGVPFFNVRAGSAATYAKSGRCSSSDGIFAVEDVTLTSQHVVGSDICIHSQDSVWLPQQNEFQPTSVVSMPDLADCKSKCNPSANPGLVEGQNAVEANMIFPDFGAFIDDAYDCFSGAGVCENDERTTFFGTNLGNSILGADRTTLENAGVISSTDPLVVGQVVDMTRAEFLSINTLPSDLVYEVACSGGGNKARLTFDGSAGVMEDSVLLTNCFVEFDDGTEIVGSVVITDRITNNAVLTASNNVTIGDRVSGTCDIDDRSIIMAKSRVGFPAAVGLSNVTFIVDDDVDVASGTSSSTALDGFAIYASGRVHMAAQRVLSSCGNDDDFLTPFGQLVRIVMPPSSNGS